MLRVRGNFKFSRTIFNETYFLENDRLKREKFHPRFLSSDLIKFEWPDKSSSSIFPKTEAFSFNGEVLFFLCDSLDTLYNFSLKKKARAVTYDKREAFGERRSGVCAQNVEGAYVRSKDARESPGPRCPCSLLSTPLCHISLRCLRLGLGYRLLQTLFTRTTWTRSFCGGVHRKVTFKRQANASRLSAACPFAALCHVNANVLLDNVTTPLDEQRKCLSPSWEM